MNKRSFLIFIGGVFLFGVFTGHQLSFSPQVDTNKLLNVVGLLYAFLGVMVLSEIVASSSRLKQICVNLIAPMVLWLHTVIPLGVFFGAVFARSSPSGAAMSALAIGFWSYSLVPLAFLEGTIVFPRFKSLIEIEPRWRYFGLFVILSGIVLQLISAINGL